MRLTLTDENGIVLSHWDVVENYPENDVDIDDDVIYVSDLLDGHLLTSDVGNEIENCWKNGRR